MTTQPRDLSLDLLKGFGCVLMIFAHVISPATRIESWGSFLILTGNLAPVVFFPAAGATAALQLRRYPLSRLIPSYLSLGLFGILLACIVQPRLYTLFDVEILNIIALGALATLVTERFLKPDPLGYAALGLILITLKFAIPYVAPNLPGIGFIYPRTDAYFENLSLHGLPKPLPGFPLLPWAGFFLLGTGVYRINNGFNLILALLSSAALLVLQLAQLDPGIKDMTAKWDMSFGYCLFALTLVFWSFYLARRFAFLWLDRPSTLVLWGRYSLLFLPVHATAIILVILIQVLPLWAGWVLAFVLLDFLMPWFVRRRPWRLFKTPTAWIGFAVLTLALPAVAEMNPAAEIVVRLLGWILGLVYVVNQPALAELLKRPDREQVSSVTSTSV